MRIGIDARFLGPEGKGLGRYTDELVRRLPRIGPEHQYVLFLRRENWHRAAQHPRIERVLAPFRWYTMAEQLRLPRVIDRQQLDLVHFPHFNVPLFVRTPFVVTVHDLILTHFSTARASILEPLRYRAKHIAYQLVIRAAVQRARRILTGSQFSKKGIVAAYGLPPERVVVTNYGADWSQERADTEQEPAVQRHIYAPYFLYVGNAYPHKNLERLIAALGTIMGRGLMIQLVLVGAEDHFYRRLKQYAGEALLPELRGRIVFANEVPDAELLWLYRHALAYVLPSLAEGFGLPPLEAMRAGTPVVASNATCIPEVLGDAAYYFNPYEVSDIARALHAVAEDQHLRQSLAARGRTHVRRYSWDTMVETTLSVYTDAVRSRSPRRESTDANGRRAPRARRLRRSRSTHPQTR